MWFFSFTLFEKNTTVLPLGCKQYNTIGCIHTTMLECKELKNACFNLIITCVQNFNSHPWHLFELFVLMRTKENQTSYFAQK